MCKRSLVFTGAPHQVPTVLSITGAALICVSTLSLGAFEKTHPQPSTSPGNSAHGASALAPPDGLGAYEAVPLAEQAPVLHPPGLMGALEQPLRGQAPAL